MGTHTIAQDTNHAIDDNEMLIKWVIDLKQVLTTWFGPNATQLFQFLQIKKMQMGGYVHAIMLLNNNLLKYLEGAFLKYVFKRWVRGCWFFLAGS